MVYGGQALSSESPDTYFEMSFAPSIELVSVVRRFVGTFYERALASPELAQRAALAAHELLENAVKYSTDGETTIRMDVQRHPRPKVVIRTRNRASPANAENLRARLAELNASSDITQHYMTLLRRSVKIANSEGRGGLGLGRIAAEADMDLTVSIDEATGRVEISARTREA